MATRYSIFPSINNDRLYEAVDWLARPSTDIVRDGYVPHIGGGLEVITDSPASMDVLVSIGVARVQGYRFEVYSEPEILTIPTADPTNPRIDRIVARLDLSQRLIELAVLQGAADATPSAPSLTRDLDVAGVWEISLAQISVGAAVTQINAVDITDERDDAAFCGQAIPPSADTIDGLHVQASNSRGLHAISFSTAAPSGGSDGDVWLQYE